MTDSESCVIGICGGDDRQIYLANELIQRGKRVVVYGMPMKQVDSKCTRALSLKNMLEQVQVIAAPIPFSQDDLWISAGVEEKDMTLDNLVGQLSKEQLLFAGVIKPWK